MDEVKAKIDEIQGARGDCLKRKFIAVMSKNPDVKLLESVRIVEWKSNYPPRKIQHF